MQLTRAAYDRAAEFLRENARPLERALFAHAFEGAPAANAVAELSKFANDDGGFGNALELDLRAPDSSGLATSHALTILRSLDQPAGQPLVAGALAWLQHHYDASCAAWRAVPANVDEHPHANHWASSLHAPGGGWPVAVIPGAEVLGHYVHYGCDARAQLEAAGAGLISALPNESLGPDGVLYLDRLARTEGIPQELAAALDEHLPRLALGMLERDSSKWDGYVANPLKLAPLPSSTVAGLFRDAIDENLDWAIAHQRADGAWTPNWDWRGAFPDAWATACREWEGILTLERLESFRAYGRLGA